ncbi:MAG: TetR/AcrR family transcriptional regulator [Myxococcales bacterium]|nr:TetR/AcrR family transcriptional regulator [Myxococcales bacterium]
MTKQRRYDAEASRRDILAAAEELFVERGFARTSTAEIARSAGVSPSQINYHFGSKEKLWREIHALKFKEYYKVQVELLSGRDLGVETVARSMEAYFRFFQNDQRFARLMMWNLLEVGGMGEGESGRLLGLGRDVIAEAQRAGRLRDDIDPGLTLMAFLGIVSWWFQARDEFCEKLGIEDPDAHEERYLETVTKLITEGIGPRD